MKISDVCLAWDIGMETFQAQQDYNAMSPVLNIWQNIFQPIV